MYRQRWFACSLFVPLALVNAAVGLYILITTVFQLRERELSRVDMVTLDLLEGELLAADGAFALLQIALSLFLLLSSAAFLMSLLTLFRTSLPRYRLMERLCQRLRELGELDDGNGRNAAHRDQPDPRQNSGKKREDSGDSGDTTRY